VSALAMVHNIIQMYDPDMDKEDDIDNRVVHGSHFSLHFQTHFWLIFTLTCKNIKMSQK
jgi:hypothetical protein